MISYLIRRTGQAIVVVLGVSIVVFILIHMLPGGPRALLGPRTTPEQVHAFIVANGYNKPIFVQYWRYLANLVRGNLGYSYHYNQTVDSLIAENLPKTGVLVGISTALAIIVSLPLGILQAVRRNKPDDYVLTAASFVAYSMPAFWLGLLFVELFSIELHWLPPLAPQGATVGAVLQQPSAMVLPIGTLAVISIASYSRFMRSSGIENLVQDYVRTARAKGASNLRTLMRHVVPNSLLPMITLVGLSLPWVVSGAILTESIFNYPGMGLLFWNAAVSHDYPVLMGTSIVVGVATVVGSLIADILYAVADPRVRYT